MLSLIKGFSLRVGKKYIDMKAKSVNMDNDIGSHCVLLHTIPK